MTFLLFALAAMVQPASAPAAQGWNVYENPRFGTRISYPDLFNERTESDNGDGVRLTARDGASLLVFASSNSGRLAPAAYLRRITARNRRYANVTYRVVRPAFAVVSGLRDGRAYYERYAFDAGGNVHAFVLEYPTAARARYEPAIARMSASLLWRGRR